MAVRDQNMVSWSVSWGFWMWAFLLLDRGLHVWHPLISGFESFDDCHLCPKGRVQVLCAGRFLWLYNWIWESNLAMCAKALLSLVLWSHLNMHKAFVVVTWRLCNSAPLWDALALFCSYVLHLFQPWSFENRSNAHGLLIAMDRSETHINGLVCTNFKLFRLWRNGDWAVPRCGPHWIKDKSPCECHGCLLALLVAATPAALPGTCSAVWKHALPNNLARRGIE